MSEAVTPDRNDMNTEHPAPDEPAHDESALTDHAGNDGEIEELETVQVEEAAAQVLPSPAELAAQLGLELPDDPDEAQAYLVLAVAAARQEAGEYLETLQRVAAEFDNYRKRVERDEADARMVLTRSILEQLLPGLDAFDAALAYEPQTDGEKAVLEGMQGTYTVVMETLAKQGFEPIEAAGKPFDPAYHEAVSGPSGEGSGDLVIAQELRKGYTLQGKVVRPTLVMVEHG